MGFGRNLQGIFAIVFFIGILTSCSVPRGKETALPPVTITTIEAFSPGLRYINNESMNDNVHSRWSKSMLNIRFRVQWAIPDEGVRYETKIRQILASNQVFPDVIRVNDPELISDLVSTGKFMDVTDAWKQYASSRLKGLYEANPRAKGPVTVDGRLYGIPVLSGGNVSDAVMWIRRDWLERLGLEAPRTIEDLEAVMDAFVRRDPDRNERDDTIGLSLSLEDGLSGGIADGSFLLGAYGAKSVDGQWGLGDDGQLYYGGIQPEMKRTLAKLHEWYQSGYLDKDVAMHDGNEAVRSFLNGVSGIVFGSPRMVGWPFPELWSLIPEADPRPYPIPAGPDGSVGRAGTPDFGGAILIRKDFEHVDRYLLYLDTIYGWSFGDTRFQYGFAEGYDFKMNGGMPMYANPRKPDELVNPLEYFVGAQDDVHIPFMQYTFYQKLRDGGTPSGHVEERMALDDPLMREAGAIVADQDNYRMVSRFYGPPTPAMLKHGEYLEHIERMTYADIVTGRAPLDAFDRFVGDWRTNGGDAITEEVNGRFRLGEFAE